MYARTHWRVPELTIKLIKKYIQYIQSLREGTLGGDVQQRYFAVDLLANKSSCYWLDILSFGPRKFSSPNVASAANRTLISLINKLSDKSGKFESKRPLMRLD
jgi:hypothetical protein